MDCSCFGPMVRVRAGGRPWGSGHEAMDRLGMGQGRGLSPEGLGKALGLCPTQTHAVLAKGRMRPRGCNPWPIVPIRWPVMPDRGANLPPRFLKIWGPLCRFQSSNSRVKYSEKS